MAKILIIEDDQINQDMLNRRLLRQGYEVLLAENGRSGVSMALSAKPDLILMDLSLPIMDGWEATKLLKSDRRTASIPILAVTAHAMVGDRDKALAAGCNDYDTKPIEWERLLPKIENLLQPNQRKLTTSSPKSTPRSPSHTRPKPDLTNAPLILVVDDNEINRDMLSKRLEMANYKTFTADSGAAGLALMKQHRFNLVLLDVMMPEMSGLEMLSLIRQKYSLLELPVIMATAKDRSEDMLEAFELGANDYIVKPIDLPVALARVKIHLRTTQNIETPTSPTVTTSDPQTPPSPTVTTSDPEPPKTSPPSAPSLLLKRYKIREKIQEEPGRKVYIGEDIQNPDLNPYLIEKISLKPEYQNLGELPDLVWIAEIENFQKFSKQDPIVKLIRHARQGKQYFTVRELIVGESLVQEIQAQKGIMMRKILGLTIELLEILVCLHHQSIIHQHLQPSSFLRRKSDGRLILNDFGVFGRLNVALDIHLDPSSPNFRNHLTMYASPEQHQGVVLPGCDIYAVGAIVLEALTRMQPNQLKKDPNTGEIIWETQVSVGNEFTTILKKAIAPNPKHRYKSAQQILDDISLLPMVALFRSQGRALK